MKLILHLGMPKTGTSSVQDTFYTHETDQFSYMKWRAPNHSGLLALLFLDNAHKQAGFQFADNPEQEVEKQRAEWLQVLPGYFAEKRNHTVLFSAESGFVVPTVARERMRDFFSNYANEIKVIVYLRPPVSFMESSLQQNVKTGQGPVELSQQWPRYRERVGDLDRIFGRENVTLVKFDRKTLIGSDIVKDFAARIGEVVPADRIVHSNESLGLKSLAFMHLLRREVRPGTQQERALLQRSLNLLVAQLQGVGPKMVLDAAIMNRVLDDQKEDLDWIEARLGAPLRDTPQQSENAISSVDDLYNIAQNVRGEMLPAFQAAAARISAPVPRDYAISLLDRF